MSGYSYQMAACCPPGRGCNWQTNFGHAISGREECLMEAAAKRCLDPTTALAMADAYRHYEQCFPLRLLTRFQCHRAYRTALAQCYQIGLEPNYWNTSRGQPFSDSSPVRITMDNPEPPWQAVQRFCDYRTGRWKAGAPPARGKADQAEQLILQVHASER